MIAFGFKMDAFKRSFFDRTAVMKKMDAKTHRALSAFGAFVRRTARSSIRKSKGISKPGQPPHAHGAKGIKEIFFGYDKAKKTVVIGPVLLNATAQPAGKTVPELLESGGQVSVTEKDGKVTLMFYRARPFMKPAFDNEKQNAKLQKLFGEAGIPLA